MLEVAEEESQVFKRGLHVSVCFWVKIAFMVNVRAGANLPKHISNQYAMYYKTQDGYIGGSVQKSISGH